MPVTMNSEPAEAEGPKIAMSRLVASENIANLLTKEQLACIGSEAVEGYLLDLKSREEWAKRNVEATKMALQVTESKSFPWPNCANVKFPLMTVAALQFLARMSILTKGRQIAKCEVIGPDPEGLQLHRAKRISAHMSYQLVEQDTNWIDDDEKAKFAASIMGCAFKKTWFDPVEGINVSEYVPASHFVVDYYTKNLLKCGRATQVLDMTSNDVKERERRGVFCKMDTTLESLPIENQLSQLSDQTQGLERPSESASGLFEVLEQHCFLDLDGDGYQEPYIVFVRSDTAQVLRIVARYFDQGDVFRVNDAAVRRLRTNGASSDSPAAKEEYEKGAAKLEAAPSNFVVRIQAQTFFTKYTFIPSIDGGFYDLGFGALLGPINKAVDTLINQQLDSGTMQVTAGGFLGRGVKIKSGKSSFDPFEWKPVDSNGDDLRKNIVPMPVNAPSPVLFQMLGLLISYAEKVSGSTDIMTGVSPGQNTPAETSRNTVEQGMKLFSGIYGRMHRAFKQELTKLYRLNQLYLENTQSFVRLSDGKGALITRGDYTTQNFQVCPAADVQVVSESQRQQKAQMVLQSALSGPGYNLYLVQREFLEAFDVQGIDQLLPDPQGPLAIPAAGNPKAELEQAKLELEKERFHFEAQKAVFEMQQAVELNKAEISKMEAQATKLLSDASGIDTGHQIAAINAATGAAKVHQEGMVKSLVHMQKVTDQMHKQRELDQTEKANAAVESASSAAAGPAAPTDAAAPTPTEGL